MSVRKIAVINIVVLAAILLGSCTSHRQLVYLKDVDSSSGGGSFYPKSRPEYLIQSRDVLYVKIYSMNEEMSNIINQTMGNSQQNLYQNETSLFINGYVVSDSGNIELPILGKMNVAGKTLDEALASIKQRTSQYLKDATVTVKMISFKVSVIGEVNRPGTYYNYNSQLTVLEAISMAGDITDYGNRHKVHVLRSGSKGTTSFQLDLTNKKILTTDGFFLLPNDVIYVEPIQSKTFRINIPTLSLFLTSVSTLILVLNYINHN